MPNKITSGKKKNKITSVLFKLLFVIDYSHPEVEKMVGRIALKGWSLGNNITCTWKFVLLVQIPRAPSQTIELEALGIEPRNQWFNKPSKIIPKFTKV